MGKVVKPEAFEQKRQTRQLERRDARADAMKERLRQAREGRSDQDRATRKLLDMFRRKPE